MRRAHPLRSLAAGVMAAFALVLLADVLAPDTLRRPDTLSASTPASLTD